jgi:hypothetical protein
VHRGGGKARSMRNENDGDGKEKESDIHADHFLIWLGSCC